MEVVDHETPSLENGQTDKEVEENANVLQFMDSMDAYLTLIHSLSSTLRRGWLELASARHSMGASRVNTVLLDHTSHPAATSLLVTQDEGKVDSGKPHFTLCKWASSSNENSLLGEKQSSQDKLHPQLRHRGSTELYVCFKRRRPHLRIELHAKLMTQFKRRDLNHCQCLELLFLQSFEPPSYHLRQH
ncbi:hypothetical protein Godav_019280 [Gossypium davidsonii]|uniref:Vacuolar ATPase assembly protein VMA22 n=2 Tax=Gossypium TaxID=3633 RepID=A0A7J8QZ69_GOSDV|nr:hypothetical protein [Gossypium davidsonii]MBA0641836.1 hypothetical protein [Gossypium klotzschianum]